MHALFLTAICLAGYLVAYNTYGKFLGKKIFKLASKSPVPSQKLFDGIDYVPAKKTVVFGHHFTSIAGTGPIVGPAIGIIWGWLPATIWVLFGSIFMGAVHDFGSLVVSMRNDGKSISEVAAKYINTRVRFIFFAIVFLVLLIVIAIFGVVIAVVFARFPGSVLAVWLQIPFAIALGYTIYKKNANLTGATILAVAAMYLTVWLGSICKITIPDFTFLPATGTWTILLLVYAWIASILPVTTLLQPRDYINAWQLFIMMAILFAGIILTSFTSMLPVAAPCINASPQGAPPLMPFLFITIACGAVSGFHSLVASGTSPKQLKNESDALFVGYGSMLTEGILAVLVIVCVAAGIGIAYETPSGQILTGIDAWNQHYSTWSGAAGLGAKLTAVVVGAANIMKSLHLPNNLGIALMGVFIASFAGTTLDTSVRLQRYVISEMAQTLSMPKLASRYTATTLAVLTAAALAFAAGANGKGAMKLWPLFGTVNQLLAALALLVVTMYLKKKGGMKFLLTFAPSVIMLNLTIWALIYKLSDFFTQQNWLLFAIGITILVLAIWMVAEALLLLCKKQKA